MIDVILVQTTRMILLSKLSGKLVIINDHDEPDFGLSSHEHAMDVFSPVVVTPGVYDEDGEEITPPVLDNRTFAMLRATQEVIDALDPAVIANQADTDLVNAYRRWA